MDCPDSFNRTALDHPPVARGLGILAEQFHFVTDQNRRQHGVGVDPDLSVITDRANLHADLIGMTDHHHSERVGVIGFGIEHDSRVAFEGMDLPALGHVSLHLWFEHTSRHGSLEADWAWGIENGAHQLKSFIGHRFLPRLHRFSHVYSFGLRCIGGVRLPSRIYSICGDILSGRAVLIIRIHFVKMVPR